MTLVPRLLALWLAAFWLPLTMHCELAAMDLCCELSICCDDHSSCNDHSCCGDPGNCATEGCRILESGNYRPNEDSASVPVASVDWIESFDVPVCRSMPAPIVILNESTGAPPGCLRVWQFVFRAAPAPRAPSAFC